MRGFIVFISLIILAVQAFEKYTRPIELAKPNKDGVYEFELVVSTKLTMSYSDFTLGHRTPVDYDPDKRVFTKRNPDAGSECNSTLDASEFSPRTNPNYLLELEDILMMDGLHRRIVTINGKSPGPLIVVPYMAEVHLRVHNQLLMDSFSIHVHGIDKKGQWYEDGVAFLQQCPITTGTKYEYRFFADRPGTHWWHGHLQVDRGTGLLGGFVVMPEDRTVPLENKERVLPSREYFMLLQDYTIMPQKDRIKMVLESTTKWYYGFKDPEQCFTGLKMSDGTNVGGASPFDSIVINDKGWYDLRDVIQRPDSLPLETFKIKRKENVLLRVVNGGTNTILMMHVQGHNMILVSADGNEILPLTPDKLIIMPGERYDILIQGLDRPTKKGYHIVVETLEYFRGVTNDPFQMHYGFAKLEYEDFKEQSVNTRPVPASLFHPECTVTKKCRVFNCPFARFPPDRPFQCIHYFDLNAKEAINDPELMQDEQFDSGFEEHFVNMQFDTNVNGFSYRMPSGMPHFHQRNLDAVANKCDPEKCPEDAPRHSPGCRCFFHLTHKLGNIVQVTLYNMHASLALAAHPIHIHGTHVRIMKVGWPIVNETGQVIDNNIDLPCKIGDSKADACNSLQWTNSSWLRGAVPGMNTKNPPLRDTFLLPVGGYVVFRYRAINPGWWFLHCHFELHSASGSAFAFRVGEEDEIPKPPRDFPKDCGLYRNPQVSKLAIDFKNGIIPDYARKGGQKRDLPDVIIENKDLFGVSQGVLLAWFIGITVFVTLILLCFCWLCVRAFQDRDERLIR